MNNPVASPIPSTANPDEGHRIEPGIMLVTLLAAIGCAAFAFWPEPPSPARLAAKELRVIGAAERRANIAFVDIWKDLEQGGRPELAAEQIEQVVLPSWHFAQARIEAVDHGRLAPFMPDRLGEFFRQREIAWIALSNALRDNDPIEAMHFRRAWKAADRIAEEIRATRSMGE